MSGDAGPSLDNHDLSAASDGAQHSAAPSRNSKPGKSGRLACDTCRERKVACNRDYPRCGRCARLGNPCSYRGRARYRESQADLPRQLKQLQERLSQAEAKLSTQQQQHPSPTSNLPTSAAESGSSPEVVFAAQSQPAYSYSSAGLPTSAFISELGHDPNAAAYEINDSFLSCIPKEILEFEHSSIDWLRSPPTVDFLMQDGNQNFIDEFLGGAPPSTMELSPPASQNQQPLASMAGPRPTPPPITPSLSGTTPTLVSLPAPDSTAQKKASCSPTGDSAEVNVTPSDVLDMQHVYFHVFYPIMPILCRDRFFAHIQQGQNSPQVKALSYAVALIGAMVSPEHHHFEAACEEAVRSHVDLCERDDDMSAMVSLDLFQALLFLLRYELTHRKIARAWITVSRAVQLANMLGLHLDSSQASGSELHQVLPPTTDPLVVEERRRALWTLYVCETYASSRARQRPLLREAQIDIPLPSPGPLDAHFTLFPMEKLADSYSIDDAEKNRISSFAGIVLACAVARQCQPWAETVATINPRPTSADSQAASHSSIQTLSKGTALSVQGFWDRHFSLLSVLRHRVELLSPHLTVYAVQSDPVSFGLYVYLCGIDIALQETAVAQVEKQVLSPAVAADSVKQSRAAAYRLVGAARGTLPRNRASPDFFFLQGALMARPLATALHVLARDLRSRPDDKSSSTIADSLHVLLGALDRLEETDGFWHETVTPVASLLKDWEEAHKNRPADTWAMALLPE
ncbi:hypothetical protein PG996_014442 [Apiospora saccharicola]|uniref:Zn(2)-C6 fungal-type domain-containing protein n=1 Tax=Apiospora saccharicola TaxID=335842 RepID=A0ABR1TIC7_9PEZI